MSNGEYLISDDGPNRSGKGTVLREARRLLEYISFYNFCTRDEVPFRTASIVEPPQLPMYAYASHPAARDSAGNLLSWRNMLKEGQAEELLSVGAPGETEREVKFAEGFLTARAIIERYMFEEFPWTFNCRLNPYINMLPNIRTSFFPMRNQMGDYEETAWERSPFERIVIKDRGSASTAVFQGTNERVRALMERVYAAGELMPEDITFILLPPSITSWNSTSNTRENDVDVHDRAAESQVERYVNLRRDWGGVFSKNIVYIFNDPSGETNDLFQPVLLMSLVILALKQNKELRWFENGGELNDINLDMRGVLNLMSRSIDGRMWDRLTALLHSDSSYYFEGIPLKLFSGDIGLVELPASSSALPPKYKIILAEKLSDRVYTD